jgi:hypothetical protein
VRRRIVRLLPAICGLCLALSLHGGAAAAAAPPPRLTALHFHGSFVPMQLTASAGRIWVVGSNDLSTFSQCQLEEIIPSTLATTFFPLPACPTDIAAVDGKVDMVAAAPQASGNTHEMHLEVFDPQTGRTQVLAPIVMGIEGSGIAHTNFVAGNGQLWLYGYQGTAGQQAVGISPQSGTVTATVTDPPEIGGIFPALAANAAGQWFGGGPGGPPGLAWTAVDGKTTTVYAGARRSAILWLSAIGGTVWAAVDDEGSGERPSNVTHLVAVNRRGHVVVSTHPEQTGDYPLVPAAGRLWSMAWVGSCGQPAELVEVDSTTGASHLAEPLPAPPGACNDADTGSQVAAVGRDVFVLIPTGESGSGVLYRAAT